MHELINENTDQRLLESLLARTPARLAKGRAGASYRTSDWLSLRADHAFALDAVHDVLDFEHDLGLDFTSSLGGFWIQTSAKTKSDYLLRPDWGRKLDSQARQTLKSLCLHQPDLQIIIGDGLSAAAVRKQVPTLLPMLIQQAQAQGWSVGRPFAIQHCRVGVLNDIGSTLEPKVAVLLIGERPGLATSESLSAYMAYKPRQGHTDAQRNLISNIHERGVSNADAARRILALANTMRRLEMSGVEVKESIDQAIND